MDERMVKEFRSLVKSEPFRVFLKELLKMRYNNNDLAAVAGRVDGMEELTKTVAVQSGYVNAIDSVITLIETLSSESIGEL